MIREYEPEAILKVEEF